MGTYHSQRLDAEHEWVRDHVARVGKGVFLPELGEEGLGGGNRLVALDPVSWWRKCQSIFLTYDSDLAAEVSYLQRSSGEMHLRTEIDQFHGE